MHGEGPFDEMHVSILTEGRRDGINPFAPRVHATTLRHDDDRHLQGELLHPVHEEAPVHAPSPQLPPPPPLFTAKILAKASLLIFKLSSSTAMT